MAKSNARLSLALVLLWPFSVLAADYENDVLSLDGRNFFVQGMPDIASDLSGKIPLRFSPILKEFLDSDEALHGYSMSLRETGFEASDVVNRGLAFPLIDAKKFEAQGYDTYRLGALLEFIPKEADLEFSVSCGYNSELDSLNACTLVVAYPYATNISIEALKFFPGPISEAAKEFETIAKRITQIAICLDVTDDLVEEHTITSGALWQESLTPEGCQIEIVG